MPTAMPRPESVVDVSVPVLSDVSPESTAYSRSLPKAGEPPLIVSSASISSRLPPAAGAVLPTLNVSWSLPPLAVVAPLIAWTLNDVVAVVAVYIGRAGVRALDREHVAGGAEADVQRRERVVVDDAAGHVETGDRRRSQRAGVGVAVAGVFHVEDVGPVASVEIEGAVDSIHDSRGRSPDR